MTGPAPAPAPIPAVVLAAGMSRRMGRFKPLLPLGDRPVIGHLIAALREGGADPILVITGHRAAEIEAALNPLGVGFVHNPHFATEPMLSSTKIGLSSLSPPPVAFMLAPADHPAVAPATVRELVRTWHATRAPLVVPTYDDHRGHPFVVAGGLIPDILALPENDSMKTIVTRYDAQTVRVPVSDSGVLEDLDTPEDYARLAGQWAQRMETRTAHRTFQRRP